MIKAPTAEDKNTERENNDKDFDVTDPDNKTESISTIDINKNPEIRLCWGVFV